MYLGVGIDTVSYFHRGVDGFVGLTVKPTFAIELPEDFDETVFFLRGGVSFQLDICFVTAIFSPIVSFV